MHADRKSLAGRPANPSLPASAARSHLIVLAAVLVGLQGATATPARAQARVVPTPAGAVRVVEVFDPSDGSRTRRPMADLTPPEIAAIQLALVRADRLGAATGILDEPTRAALRRFQRERELEPCGCPSYETLLALGIEPRVVQILVRSSPETTRTGAAPGAASAPEIPRVRVVYGTPPRQPRLPASADVGAPGGGGPEAGARGAEALEGPSGSTGLIEDRLFTSSERHLLLPVFVGSPFFPPKPKPIRSDPGQRRGLPFGRRPVVEPPIGISPRSPPRR